VGAVALLVAGLFALRRPRSAQAAGRAIEIMTAFYRRLAEDPAARWSGHYRDRSRV